MTQDHFIPSTEIRSENITDELVASYKAQGYTLDFAEEVMRYDLSRTPPPISVPFEISYLNWTPERAHTFFTVYDAAFRERPGFPGWSEAEWVDRTASDPAFRSDLSFLAMVRFQAVGFVTNDDEGQHGFLSQVGVHPDWRGQGIGTALTIRTLQKWQETGKEAVILHVNVNNPGAIHLYQQLGFVVIWRRGKFSRPAGSCSG
jgi:ribosomal protein S18 acetylase RimI-like enzyme